MNAKMSSRAYFSTGDTISALQLRGLSRSGPRLVAVKRCCDQAVKDVFAGHATVQAQGSARKGTAVQGQSDIDLYVNLDSTIDTVTRAQREDVENKVRQCISHAGIQYNLRRGENRIQMTNGQDKAGMLPNTDLVFASYKQRERIPPDARAMADSHVAQQVVRYIKLMPEAFSNLPAPHSFHTEQLVKLMNNMQPATDDTRGFEQLMISVLNEIVETDAARQGFMQQANLHSREWSIAADNILQGWAQNKGWLQVW